MIFMLYTYELCLCEPLLYNSFFLELCIEVVFSKCRIKKADLQFALCNQSNSGQALFLPYDKTQQRKTQIKPGSRRELSNFLASKHKYPT